MNQQTEIENRLGEMDPQVEVILVEQIGSRENPTVRVVIDHPEGVNHELCGRVTKALTDTREEYNLEVSSPGVDRPLTKPKHFNEHIGERIGVRTKGAIDGRRNFKGVLVGIENGDITVDCEGTKVSIPEREIKKSKLLQRDGGTRP